MQSALLNFPIEIQQIYMYGMRLSIVQDSTTNIIFKRFWNSVDLYEAKAQSSSGNSEKKREKYTKDYEV